MSLYFLFQMSEVPVNEEVLNSKLAEVVEEGMMFGLVDILILIVLIGGAFYWFFLRKKEDSSFDASSIKSFSIEYVLVAKSQQLVLHSHLRFSLKRIPSILAHDYFLAQKLHGQEP